MLLTLRVTGSQASDLEVLLDKSPDKLHSTRLPFGDVHVFFPEVSPDAVTVALVVDVAAVDWSPNGSTHGIVMPNAAILSAAIARAFSTALAARSPSRPDLVTSILPLEATVSSFVVRPETDDPRTLFAPLGYEVEVTNDASLEPNSSSTNFIRQTVRLAKHCPLYEILSHLYVLGPVLDGHADDRVLEGERDALILHAEGAARGHPAGDRIMHAYTARRPSGVSVALSRLLATDATDATDATEGQTDLDLGVMPTLLDDARVDAVVLELREASAHSVIDLGCGDGRLLARLVREKTLTRIVGLDVSTRALDAAATRMKLDRRGTRKSERIELLHGSIFYADSRLRGFDAAVLSDVVQYVAQDRLGDIESAVFHDALPATVVAMMNGTNRDGTVPAGMENRWSINQFDAWACGVSERRGYRVRLLSLASSGVTTRMAVFSR